MTEPFSHDEVVNLEFDETIPPRPEEEIADVARADREPVDPQRG
ncbi:hypothetical protein [Pengzhenrongella frigida]|nr:hypothetical protein [Cellulomonas sp. HLT2-17]